MDYKQLTVGEQSKSDLHYPGIIPNNVETCPGDTSGFVFSNMPAYTRSSGGEFVSTPLLKPASMLGAYAKAAFSLNLSVYGLHTNWYQRLTNFDTGDINAFALEP